MSEMNEEMDLKEYLVQLLTTNDSSDGLRKRIQNDIQLTKSQLNEHLLTFGIDFEELDTNYHQMMALNTEMKSLETQLNVFIGSDLMTKIEKLKDICHELNDRMIRSKELTEFIDKLKQLYSEIDLIDQSFSLNSYEMSFQYMSSASQLYSQLMDTIESNDDLKTVSDDLNCFMRSLKTDLCLKREEMIYNSKQLFNSNVKAFRDEMNDKNVFEFNLIQYLKTNDYKNFIKTLVDIEENNSVLNELIKRLNLFFIKPILNEEINQLVLEDNRIVGNFSANRSDTSCDPLSLLKLFFDYFNQLLTNKNEIPIGRQLSSLFGHIWSKDIFDQILKYYLNRLLPKNESDVKKYLSLIDSAEDIRHFLIEIGFIEDNTNSPFIEFSLNINYHFCRRLCTDFVIESKAIVCRELHQTVEVDNDSDSHLNPFPSCRVSQSLVELKHLFEQILELFDHSSSECCEGLIETMENICELYIDISPIYHKQMINEFLQQNAIFHNNCMFFSHFIESFALKNKSLKKVTEMVPVIQRLGSEVFLKQMRFQEKKLLEPIQSQQFCHCLNDLVNEDTKDSSIGDRLAEEFRHSLNQCLVYLNFLKNALIDVLPQRVYEKAIGTVVNTLFIELINKIVVLNDISSSGAVRLSQEIEFLLKETQMFLKSENPMRLVQKWSKLSELNFILKANLLDIVNRWADGKGILAAELTAQEVKQMIRCLFQNTERRAKAINKINY